MQVHRTLIAAAALTAAALAGGRTRRTRRNRRVAAEVPTTLRPRASTVCATSSHIVTTAVQTARTHAAAPTRVALCAVTSAGFGA